jgi:hypothetical protein
MDNNGIEKWEYRFPSSSNIPGIAIGKDGTIYIGAEYSLYAMNPDGTLKWKFYIGETIRTVAAIADNGITYWGTGYHGVYALNPDGTLLWNFPLKVTSSSPVVGPDERIHFYANDNYVYTLKPDGALQWKLWNASNFSSPTIGSDGTVYLGDNSNKLFALNPDGTEKWKYTAQNSGYYLVIGFDNTIYYCSYNNFIALNSDGTPRWGSSASDYFRYPSIGADGTIYVGCGNQLYAFAPAAITLTSSFDGKKLSSGSQQTITWTCTGTDSLRFDYSLDDGATWNTVSSSIKASPGSYVWTLPDANSSKCRIRLVNPVIPTVMDASDLPFSIHDLKPGISIDANLRTAGNQEEDGIENIGGSALIGFAVYGLNWEGARGYTVSLSWDPAKAEFLPSLAGTAITGDERTINGFTFTPAAESNILGGTLISAGEKSSPGSYSKSFALFGDVSPGKAEGLDYLAVFRTASAFQLRDILAIRAAVRIADANGVERDLEARSFAIRGDLLPPSNLRATDIPKDQGHRLRLTWTVSASEQVGMVSGYRIYRSRSNVFANPIPLTRFASLDSLIFYEQRAVVLIDSVAAGKTEFIDPFVPLAGVPYYYWAQTVGVLGVSKPVISTMETAVEEAVQVPLEFRLGEAYPNPFNPNTTIEYVLPGELPVLLEVYNISGQKVATVENGLRSAGKHAAVWDARGLPSGVYIYTLRAGRFAKSGKAMLVK